MSDATDRGPTSAGIGPPDETDDEEFSKDEVTEATPPDPEEAEDAPEADVAPQRPAE